MSKATGALLMVLSILLGIYAILQFLVTPRINGMKTARRETTHVYGIPLPPIVRVVSIVVLIVFLAFSALMFIIGKLYYGSE